MPLGALAHDGPATPEQLSLIIPITGSPAQGATATCRYKRTVDSVFITGHPLYRIRPDLSLSAGSPNASGTVIDAFAWPIIDLKPGTSYDVEVTVVGSGLDAVLTQTFVTRTIPAQPGPANQTITAGSSTATINTKIGTLVAGDVCQLAVGTYNTTGVVINRAGTSGSPIYIRGASKTGTIISDTTGGIHSIVSFGSAAAHIILENLTIRGTLADGLLNTQCIGIFFNGGAIQPRITIRNCIINGVDVGIGSDHEIQECLVYCNTLTGNNTWTKQSTPGTFDIDTNLTWNDDGCRIPGFGNCAFNNTISGFGDAMSYSQSNSGNGLAEARGIHFYRNDILFTCDDGTEVDDGLRNLTFYDNRIWNSMTFISLDPIFGGPLLVARNIAINTGRTPFKWQDPQSGMFVYNNTMCHTTTRYLTTDGAGAEAGWYQPGVAGESISDSYGYRNNILVYRGSGTHEIRFDNTGHNIVDWTNNSWYPDLLFNWPQGSFANLAAAIAGLSATTPIFSGQTHRMTNDNITVSNPWTTTITLGSDYHTQVVTAYLPTLVDGSAPRNSGVVIPNVTDGFGGVAPDRGAVIIGRPAVKYGNLFTAWVDTLNAGEWYKIPNTAMSSVAPSPTPPGNTGPESKIITWTSMCMDPRNSKLYSVAGGGHTDYSGNEVDTLALEVEPPAWLEVLAPTPAASVIASSAFYADNRPTSRHHYYGLTFVGQDDRFMLVAGSQYGNGNTVSQVQSYNITANTYNGPGTHDNVTGNWGADIGTITVDPSTGNMYGVANGTASKWTQSTNTFVIPSSTGSRPNGNYTSSAFDTLRGRAFFLGGLFGDRHIFTVATSVFTTVTITGASAGNVQNAQQTIVYVPELDKYLVTGGVVAAPVYQIDPVTFVATPFTTIGGESIPATNVTGCFNKFCYAPKLGGFAYVPDYSTDAWFLKVVSVNGSAIAAGGGGGGGGAGTAVWAWIHI